MRVVYLTKKKTPSKKRSICAMKRPYRTIVGAAASAIRYFTNGQSISIPYSCEVCKQWHLTSHFQIEDKKGKVLWLN